MEKNESGFFWGVLAVAAAVAVAGAVALTCYFRSSEDGGVAGEGPLKGKTKPKPVGGKTGNARRVRRVAAKK